MTKTRSYLVSYRIPSKNVITGTLIEATSREQAERKFRDETAYAGHGLRRTRP